MNILENIPYMTIGAAAILTSNPFIFLLFAYFNMMLNNVLKDSIHQSRPKDCEPYLKKTYGMPSGHSQNVSFATAFVWFEMNRFQQMIFALLVVTTMVQRVVTNCHTIPQVFAGVTVGTLFGFISYRLVKELNKKGISA